jgi:hypothetical protein
MKRFLTPSLTLLLAVSAAAAHASGSIALRANVAPGEVLDPGDPVSFRLQATAGGTVVVFDIDTQGYVHLLHPFDAPEVLAANETLEIPSDGSELVAGGEPGVEFVFALVVDDPAALDAAALDALRGGPGGMPRRITGDPFVAANMIAAELVRNISSSGVTFGYTWFHVSQRVDYPCYLCGECDNDVTANGCEGAHIAQNFDRRPVLTYPLRRGYDVSESVAAATEEPAPSSSIVIPDDGDDVIVNFYPYGSEVRYADPFATNLWYDWGWYDPFFWSYPGCYPYYGPGWSVSIGFGWGWGWGGYYCSGWYDPWYGCGGYYPYYPYDPYYPDYPGSAPEPFKSKYKSGGGESATSLAGNYKYASKHDGELRVASKNVRAAPARTATTRTKTTVAGSRTTYTGNRVKTSVSAQGYRGMVRDQFSRWRSDGNTRGVAPGRTGSAGYGSKSNPSSTSGGRSVIQRGGGNSGRSKSSAMSPGGSSRPAPTGRTSSPQMKSGGSRSTPSSSSRGSGMYRGGSSGGSRSAPRGGKGR